MDIEKEIKIEFKQNPKEKESYDIFVDSSLISNVSKKDIYREIFTKADEFVTRFTGDLSAARTTVMMDPKIGYFKRFIHNRWDDSILEYISQAIILDSYSRRKIYVIRIISSDIDILNLPWEALELSQGTPICFFRNILIVRSPKNNYTDIEINKNDDILILTSFLSNKNIEDSLRKEIRKICSIGFSKINIRKECNKANWLFLRRENYPIIHLTSHADINGLQLSNFILGYKELLSIKKRKKLLFLSACSSASYFNNSIPLSDFICNAKLSYFIGFQYNIGTDYARDFSIFFYRNLLATSDVLFSFLKARSEVRTKSGDSYIYYPVLYQHTNR